MQPPPGGYGPPRGGYPGYGLQGQAGQAAAAHKPITGSAETMAMHAMTIDPKTGLPKGEKPPATPAAVLSLVCGVLLCLGPVTGLTAIVAGLVARAQVQRRPTAIGGGSMAAVGIALGALNLLISALGVFYYLSAAP
ncbi:MAG TPA: DUF4190 domain-containing protein [Polyangiaceae bacterium]|nr:DUF4190 domain-containing protein [Polyangiaceae bacterium]